MTFDKLGLSEPLLRAVREKGYTEPTVIQNKCIPIILEGKDIMGGAQTGTGKTAGFTLPLLQNLLLSATFQKNRPVRCLILTPTRELAAQVSKSVEVYGKYVPLTSTCVFGGVAIGPQVTALRKGVDILIATPGRLLDHVQQRNVDLSKVEIFVLDEADRMLDMGFLPDIKRVLHLIPEKRQNLLFSATFSDEIQRLSRSLLNSPVYVQAAPGKPTADLVTQVIHPVDRHAKSHFLPILLGVTIGNKFLYLPVPNMVPTSSHNTFTEKGSPPVPSMGTSPNLPVLLPWLISKPVVFEFFVPLILLHEAWILSNFLMW